MNVRRERKFVMCSICCSSSRSSSSGSSGGGGGASSLTDKLNRFIIHWINSFEKLLVAVLLSTSCRCPAIPPQLRCVCSWIIIDSIVSDSSIHFTRRRICGLHGFTKRRLITSTQSSPSSAVLSKKGWRRVESFCTVLCLRPLLLHRWCSNPSIHVVLISTLFNVCYAVVPEHASELNTE